METEGLQAGKVHKMSRSRSESSKQESTTTDAQVKQSRSKWLKSCSDKIGTRKKCTDTIDTKKNLRGNRDTKKNLRGNRDTRKNCTDKMVTRNKLETSGELETSKINKNKRSSKQKCHPDQHKKKDMSDTDKPQHSVKRGVDNAKTYQEAPGFKLASHGSGTARIRSVVAEVCGSVGHSDEAARPTHSRYDNMEVKRQSEKCSDHDRDSRASRRSRSKHSSASPKSNMRSSGQPDRRLGRSRKRQHKLSDVTSRKMSLHGQGGVHEAGMIPLVEQMFAVNDHKALFNQGRKHISQIRLSKHKARNIETKSSTVGIKSLVNDQANTVLDLSGNSRMPETSQHSELEDGEIIDIDVSDRAAGRSKKKRKHRSSRIESCESTAADVPKKRVEQVEVVDIGDIAANNLERERIVTRYQLFQEHGPSNAGSQWTASRTSTNQPAQFEHTKENKYNTRSKVKRFQLPQIDVREVPALLKKSVTTKKEGQKVDPIHQSEDSAVVLEEGELLSESDSNSNVVKVLPRSGSDMSISSMDSSTENNTVITEYKDSHVLMELVTGSRHNLSEVTQISSFVTPETAAKPQVCELNPLALPFVPKCSVPDSGTSRTEESNIVQTSSTSMTSTSYSYSSTSVAQDCQSGSMLQPSSVVCYPNTSGFISAVAPSYVTYTEPSSALQAPPNITCSSVSPMQSYTTMPQYPLQLIRDPYLESPSNLWTASSIQQTADHARPGLTVGYNDSQAYREFSSKTSGGRIHLNLSAELTCPEMTETPRSWYSVKQWDAQAGSLVFTVMSYNILSQELMERHMFLYSRCQEADLEWANRGAALLTQIIAHNADIVCLQEVQEDHWIQDIRDTLAEQGYDSAYKKQSGDKPDGCAILFKKCKFALLKVVPVEFMKGGILDRSNIGLILLLQPRSEVYAGNVKKICVATTHLLFNPRRGDVKLAQLIVFLAEIDKHAYLDDDDQTDNKHARSTTSESDSPVDVNSSPSQEKCSQNVASESFPHEMDKQRSPSEPSLKDEVSHPKQQYCPIILCGDFNSEPFSDLYKFVTTGYLKYDRLISRLVCGQQEGTWGGSDRTVDRRLLPQYLSICETCQYMQVLKERQNGTESSWAQQCPKVNSGQIFHGMNFQSVYRHFVDPPGRQRKREVSTHHNNCSCTVDYIFYSKAGARHHWKSETDEAESSSHNDSEIDPSGGRDSEIDPSGGRDMSDTQQNESGADDATHDSQDAGVVREPLELLARYRLMTTKEVKKFGSTPNCVLPSDHLCLIGKFVLR